jgi:predicted acetyltransferase
MSDPPAFDYHCPDEAEREAYGVMISHAFGFPTPEAATWFERVGHENLRVATENGHVLAGLIMIRMGQFFGGRSVPMLGVSGVGVTPEARGRGVGTFIMRACAEEGRANGFAISSLYGATTKFYQRMGWTRAGVRMEYSVDLGMLEPLEARSNGLRISQVAGAPDEVRAFYKDWAKDRPGHLDRNKQIWDRVVEPRGFTTKTFAVHEGDTMTGYTIVSHKYEGESGKLQAWCAAPKTKAAARALLSVFGSYSSVAKNVTWFGSPAHPLLSAVPERRHEIRLPWYISSRTLDVAAALRARGYPRGVSCDVSFEVARAHASAALPEREAVRLVVEGGEARVLPCKSARLVMSDQGFSALFTGFTSARELFDLGEIAETGDARTRDAIEALDGVFGGTLPSTPDFF